MAPSYSKYDVRRCLPNPSAAALLVIDMQNYFSSITSPILPSLNSTTSLSRSASILFIFTRHRHLSPSDNPIHAEWWSGDLIFDGTPESELLPDLDQNPSDRIVEKNTYSAFRGTGLEETLRGMEVEEVIVTGL